MKVRRVVSTVVRRRPNLRMESSWTRTAVYHFQVGDRVVLVESPWVGMETNGTVTAVTEQSKPKRVVYRVRLDDGSEVNAEAHHLRSAWAKAAAFDDFRFRADDEVVTPLGGGIVKDRANTPLGRLYRVQMHYDGATRDFMENELHIGRLVGANHES